MCLTELVNHVIITTLLFLQMIITSELCVLDLQEQRIRDLSGWHFLKLVNDCLLCIRRGLHPWLFRMVTLWHISIAQLITCDRFVALHRINVNATLKCVGGGRIIASGIAEAPSTTWALLHESAIDPVSVGLSACLIGMCWPLRILIINYSYKLLLKQLTQTNHFASRFCRCLFHRGGFWANVTHRIMD